MLPILGKLGAESGHLMDTPVIDEIVEPVVEIVEQMVAPMIDVEEDIAMLICDVNLVVRHSEDLMMARRFMGVKKLIKVSDAKVADSITIGEIGLSVFAIEGKLQTMVAEMSCHESTLMQCRLGMDRRLANLERRPPGPQ
ncbi:hypothetical protein Tco_0309082 [Tanacetum coccineum]